MKRFVNAYSVHRAIATLARMDIDREQLALWTITVLRWPLLAEYLEDEPEMVTHIGPQHVPPANVPKNLHELFRDEAVSQVIAGEHVGARLDEDAIRQCAILRV
jgi:hypothetical protein